MSARADKSEEEGRRRGYGEQENQKYIAKGKKGLARTQDKQRIIRKLDASLLP
jgi:hypothetical protein